MTEQWTIVTRSTLAGTRAVRAVAIDGDDAATELGVERDLLLRLAMLFEPDDLVVAVVPALLRTRLAAGAPVAAVVDTRVHVDDARVESFVRAASKRGAALARRDDAGPSDEGLVDARVVAVGPPALPVLDDWVSTLGSLDPGSGRSSARRRARAWMGGLLAAGVTDVLDAPAVGVGQSVAAPAFTLLTDGTMLDATMRALYRDALFAERIGVEPPNPFGPRGADAFVAWLREPVLPDVAPHVGRYLAHLWTESERLRDEYPELEPETADAFVDWCRVHADVPACVLPTELEEAARRARRRRARPTGPRPAGVNVVGYLGAALGLGEVARNLVEALDAADVPVAAVTNPATASRELYEVPTVAPDEAPYDVNLFVVTADMLAPLAGRLGPAFFAERRNIGLWFWEAERFRDGGPTPATVLLDEVWAPSAYVRRAIDVADLGRPVETVPIPVPVLMPPPGIDRNALGLPSDRYLFLFTFDFFSVMARKNPFATIEAYRRAFAPSDGAILVLKSINGVDRPGDLQTLRAAVADRADIVVWDDYLSPERHAGMLAACDAYVSLHRAEGLGLTMAEAMALGKPVIATSYSGNLEFMTDDVAYLVDSTLVPVGTGVDPYPADARWAEPDVGHAASLMRNVFEDGGRAAQVGERAAELIRAQWSTVSVAPRVRGLIEQARARPRDAAGTWRTFFMRGWRNRLLGPVPRQYRFDWLADGFPLDRSAHTIFSFALQRAFARRGRDMPPDPDGVDASEQMVSWLNTPIAPRRRPVLSRYLVQYWHDHPALQELFPRVESDRDQARAYREWIAQHWHEETDVDYRLAPGR